MTPEQIRMLAEKSYKSQEEAEAFIQGYNYNRSNRSTTYEEYEPNIVFWAVLSITAIIIESIVFFYLICKQ